jgi:hypothetical protein
MLPFWHDDEALFPRPIGQHYIPRSKISLNCTIKITFMRHGERSIDQGKQALGVNTCSPSLARKCRNRENTSENPLVVRPATTFGATTINATVKRAAFAGVGACERVGIVGCQRRADVFGLRRLR